MKLAIFVTGSIVTAWVLGVPWWLVAEAALFAAWVFERQRIRKGIA